MNVKFVILLCWFTLLNANISSSKEIKILDVKTLNHKELSDLAYKDEKLYIVANDGKLYSYDFKIKNKKITSIKELQSLVLKDKKLKPLKKKHKDAEGLSFYKDNFLISFERKHRVELYSLNGVKIKKMKINKALENMKSYRDKNKGLEAVIYSEKYGIITAPEKPFVGKKNHLLYAKNRTWKFKAEGNIKALEFINEDELLVLLRQSSGLIGSKTSSLLRVDLSAAQKSKAKILLKVDGNFEGLTKVYGNLYLMVSDSDGSLFQKTQLVLFELKGEN